MDNGMAEIRSELSSGAVRYTSPSHKATPAVAGSRTAVACKGCVRMADRLGLMRWLGGRAW